VPKKKPPVVGWTLTYLSEYLDLAPRTMPQRADRGEIETVEITSRGNNRLRYVPMQEVRRLLKEAGKR
jgi:hypothetical protein